MENQQVNTENKKRLGTWLLLASCVVFLGMLVLFLRGQYISDTLKGIVVPELESATGQKVTARKIVINILPLFIEAKDLIVSDTSGNKIVNARKVRGYVTLTGIFNKQITLQRLVIDGPEIRTERKQLTGIIEHVKKYLEQERKDIFKVKIRVVEVVKGAVSLNDRELKGDAGVKGLSGEFITGENPRLFAAVKELDIDKEGWPKIVCDLNTAVTFQKDRIEIKKLEVGAYGSKLRGAGTYARGKGKLTTEISLIMDSLKRLFHLGQRGDGRVSVKGDIKLGQNTTRLPSLTTRQDEFHFKGVGDIVLDLKLGGEFYLQTLMELLKVKEDLEGLVDFQGEITGRLTDISGKAKANLRNGRLYGVDLDSLKCDVLYKDGVMDFQNGSADLYHGTAEAHASIHLPVVNFFALNVKFHTIDSSAALKLIGWEPGIPAGKVEGELSSSGSAFNPDGRFVFKASGTGQRAQNTGRHAPADNVLDRIKDIKGKFSLREDVLSLPDIQIFTTVSNVDLAGDVNLKKKTLNLKGRLYAENVSDLALPYYRELKGRCSFSGDVTGTFEDPKISGSVYMNNAVIEGYQVDKIISDVAYQKNLLSLREAKFISPGEEHTIKGKIAFPEAKEIFNLAKPVYDLKASLRNAEFGSAVRIFYKDFIATGRMSADITIGGRDTDIDLSGKASVEKGSIYKIPIDSASSLMSYSHKALLLKKLKLLKGKSVLSAEVRISSDNRFSYTATSDRLFVKDLSGFERMPDDAVVTLESAGKGTLDNPSLTLVAKMAGGTFKGKNMGVGTISVSIQNRNISLTGALFNERMKIKGSGHLDDTLPWTTEVTIQQGRYDFLVSSILKEVPEDLQLNLEGRIFAKGNRKNISASAEISHLTLALFGQTFTNDSNMNFALDNRKISFNTFTVKSGSTSFQLHGGIEIDKEYDLRLNGSASLAPLKGLSKRIGYLKGDANFVLSVNGKWEKPQMNGTMDVTNASFGLKDFPNYISSINGHIYMDGDRIVLEKLSGKIGGGNVNISGLVNLKAFQVKRYYLQAKLDNINTPFSKDFTINFDGNLLCRGTTDAMNLSGDIKINRAKYKEMVEWRSWLLTKQMQELPKTELSIFEKAELNIRIAGSENISIDNNIARTSVMIRGDMILKGTISNPILFGRLESNTGYVYFRNNEFKVIFASVDFADQHRIKPVINLTAEIEIKGYDIRLNLEGQLDHFNLSLSSDPHLDEVDILGLLTVGQVGKQLKGLEGGIGAGEATSFITGKVQDVLEERMRTITGLDRFQVEPYVSNLTGTVGASVTVSKRLIGERLFVTYTNPIGSSAEQIIKLEYLLDKNISLIGSRDERGSLGSDVKFRFEFK
jgi:hypothetical protein